MTQIEGGEVQNVKMSHREKNGTEPAQKRPRTIGLFRPAQPNFLAVRVPLSSVLSICNPNHVCKPPFTRDAV
jgi:hypothetical protein